MTAAASCAVPLLSRWGTGAFSPLHELSFVSVTKSSWSEIYQFRVFVVWESPIASSLISVSPKMRCILLVALGLVSHAQAFRLCSGPMPTAAATSMRTPSSVPVMKDDRNRNPDFDPTVDIPDGGTPGSLRPKGPGGILAGLPWWFPFALGWLLAPSLPQSPLADLDIFSAPTTQQEKQILRDERSIISQGVQDELYGR